MNQQKTIDRIKKLKNLPPLPSIFVKCNEMLNDPDVSINSLAKTVQADQAISTTVLKLANSPFYGLAGKISTISQAIAILGFSSIRNIILSLSVLSLFPKNTNLGEFQVSQLWEHSIGCGVISKAFARKLGVRDLEEVFVAGMLHDVGKLVIAKLFPEEFSAILNTVNKENMLFFEAEQKILGMDHSQIGEMLGKSWRLPSSLTEPISFHHTLVDEIEHSQLASIIHIADIITLCFQIGYGGNHVMPEISKVALDTLNINSQILYAWLNDLDEDIEQASILFSIVSG